MIECVCVCVCVCVCLCLCVSVTVSENTQAHTHTPTHTHTHSHLSSSFPPLSLSTSLNFWTQQSNAPMLATRVSGRVQRVMRGTSDEGAVTLGNRSTSACPVVSYRRKDRALKSKRGKTGGGGLRREPNTHSNTQQYTGTCM